MRLLFSPSRVTVRLLRLTLALHPIVANFFTATDKKELLFFYIFTLIFFFIFFNHQTTELKWKILIKSTVDFESFGDLTCSIYQKKQVVVFHKKMYSRHTTHFTPNFSPASVLNNPATSYHAGHVLWHCHFSFFISTKCEHPASLPTFYWLREILFFILPLTFYRYK